jgi:hypothetical protein
MADLKYNVGIETGAAVTAVNHLKDQIGQLTGLIAGKFTAGSLIAFTADIFRMADQMRDMADNVNISMESLLGFQSTVLPAGVKLEQLTMSMGRLRAVQGDLIKGNPVLTAAFTQLGLPIEKVVAMPLDELLVAIGRGMVDTKSQTEAFSAVCDLFGARIGPKMVQALRDIGTQGLDGIKSKGAPAAEAMNKLAGAADTAEVSLNAIKLVSAEALNIGAKLWVSETNAIGDYIVALKDGKSTFGALVDAWKGAKEPFQKKPTPPATTPVSPDEDPAVKALRARQAAEQAKQDEKDAKERNARIQSLREKLDYRAPISPGRMGDAAIATRLAGASDTVEQLKFSQGFIDDEEKRLQITLRIRDAEEEITALKDEQKKREYDYQLGLAEDAAKEQKKKEEEQSAGEMLSNTSAPDRYAKLGLFIGGAGGPSVDYQRRAAVATELVAKNTKRIEEKMTSGGSSTSTWGS